MYKVYLGNLLVLPKFPHMTHTLRQMSDNWQGLSAEMLIWRCPQGRTCGLSPNFPGNTDHNIHLLCNVYMSAVYTGIKKPESFSHSGFLLKVARQLPLNTPKNPNRKTHLRSVIFWNSADISLVFCQCKRSLQSRRYYSGFWSRGTWPSAESPDRGPRRNAHYTCTVKGREKSRMRTTYQNTSMRFGGFSRMRFSCQKPWMLWVFLAV